MKSLFKSKTFWTNIGLGVLGIVAGGAPIPIVANVLDATGVVGLIQQHPAVATSIAAGANVALRMVTTGPVSVTGQ